MLVKVELRNGSLQTSTPEPLFQTDISVKHNWNQYCVTADGQRFLTVVPEESDRIQLVINWPELLRQSPSNE